MTISPLSSVNPALKTDSSDSLNAPPRKPSKEELAKAAQQFEAIMVRQLLAPAIEPLMEGGSLTGEESSQSGGGVYGYMLTDVLAGSISQGGGLGLASVITRQLSPAAPAAAAK